MYFICAVELNTLCNDGFLSWSSSVYRTLDPNFMKGISYSAILFFGLFVEYFFYKLLTEFKELFTIVKLSKSIYIYIYISDAHPEIIPDWSNMRNQEDKQKPLQTVGNPCASL